MKNGKDVKVVYRKYFLPRSLGEPMLVFSYQFDSQRIATWSCLQEKCRFQKSKFLIHVNNFVHAIN